MSHSSPLSQPLPIRIVGDRSGRTYTATHTYPTHHGSQIRGPGFSMRTEDVIFLPLKQKD